MSNKLTFAKMERAIEAWKRPRLIHGGLCADDRTFHSCSLWFIEYLKTLPEFRSS